ncbi:transposase [Rhizobium ruizarguesonis]
MSVGVAGATITEVAHRHDLTRQQIYAWRSELKKKGFCRHLRMHCSFQSI